MVSTDKISVKFRIKSNNEKLRKLHGSYIILNKIHSGRFLWGLRGTDKGNLFTPYNTGTLETEKGWDDSINLSFIGMGFVDRWW